jgi:hypothetical protein
MSLQRRICFHEAGHTTAAICYAVPIISVTVNADTPHLHRARYRAPSIWDWKRCVCCASPGQHRKPTT